MLEDSSTRDEEEELPTVANARGIIANENGLLTTKSNSILVNLITAVRIDVVNTCSQPINTVVWLAYLSKKIPTLGGRRLQHSDRLRRRIRP